MPDSARATCLVVVFHSDVDELAHCLESAGAATLDSCVVVDTSPDQRARTLATDQATAYVALPRNPGYGAALNAGMEARPGAATVICSNSDIIFTPNAIDELAHEATRIDGMAFPLQVDEPGGSPHPDSLLDQLSIADALRRWLILDRSLARRRRRAMLSRIQSRQSTIYLDGARYSGSGACFAISGGALGRLGGVPTDFFLQEEDRLLCHLATEVGVPMVLVGAVEVQHRGGFRSQRPTARALVDRRALELAAFARRGGTPLSVRLGSWLGLRLRTRLARR